MTFSLKYAFCINTNAIFLDPGLREIFFNPITNDTWNIGEKFKYPNLADTMEIIAEKGSKEFYEGEMAQNIVNELQEVGSIMSLKDLADYE